VKYASKGLGLFGKDTKAIMEEIVAVYEEGTANSGNKDNHNTSFYENLPASEKNFGELVESKARFYLQSMGSADLKNPNWGKKHGHKEMTFPPPGPLIYGDLVTGREVTIQDFDPKKIFRGMAYDNAQQRTKPSIRTKEDVRET